MVKIFYEVEFLSDVVLPASSNNEGNIEQLDFIPGSNFLGMVAAKYDKFEDSFKVFHSGDVKFGNATLLQESQQTYKMPLSYFHKKLDSKTLYNHHLLNENEFKEFGQLKQKRAGYITKDYKYAEIEYNYSQKSAYDKKNRRSLDSSMFGYSAIKSGTTWQFSITYNENISPKDLELLQENMIGKKRLGKSKSAEYGLVNITKKGTEESIEDTNSKETIIYLRSRVSLVDASGNPTVELHYLFDGLSKENIDYEKTQIKTSYFTPYNAKRQRKDYERVCINSGSVIVLKNIDKNRVPKYVGAYQNEGFGEIILNPLFLTKKEFSLEIKEDKDEANENVAITSDLAKFLQQQEDKQQAKIKILNEVDKFIYKHKSLSKKKMNSQWGKIRSICSNSSDENIYEDVKEYITHGVAKVKWEGKNEKNLLEGIKNSKKPLEFTKLLSIIIPKQKEEKKDD